MIPVSDPQSDQRDQHNAVVGMSPPQPTRSKSLRLEDGSGAALTARSWSSEDGPAHHPHGFLFDDDVIYQRVKDELEMLMESAPGNRYVQGENEEQDSNDDFPSLSMASPIPLVIEGVGDLVNDEFSRCFQAEEQRPWNWNIYLGSAWVIGLLVRHFILFPLRLLCFLIGTLVCASFLLALSFLPDVEARMAYQRRILQLYANIWIASWSGVVIYHGTPPKMRANQVYVANHTSMIDYIILLGVHPFSVVGQLHEGILRAVQTKMLVCLKCIWFDRKSLTDRRLVRDRISAHVGCADVPPLLIFPEGTCVANEYAVVFKKGAFELGCDVYPIAIKYNKIFVDCFWDSRSTSFWVHVLHLMRSWAVICDVHFLPPQRARNGESPESFAKRVKQQICDKIGLQSVEYDGYMKHMVASDRFIALRQMRIAAELRRRLEYLDLERRFGKDEACKLLRRRNQILKLVSSPGLAGQLD